MEDLKTTVAKRLKSLLESRNLSQTQFAEKATLSKDTVSKLLNGKMALSISNAVLIVSAFDVSLDYLFGLSEQENENQYALEILLKHFFAVKEKGVWEKPLAEVQISFSPVFAEFLVKITSLKEAKIPEDLCLEGERRAKKDFLRVIEDTSKEPIKYVLLSAELCTPEVKNAIEEAKKETHATN